ncbi:MAG: hypothetical protein K2N29_04795, partial [Ruminiclostridium sp.]|nr:hypothetical protein [Ruminiclostridium sp.]
LAPRITACLLLILSSVISILYSSNTVDFFSVSRIPQTGLLVFVAALLIPLTGVLFGLAANRSKGKKRAS